MKRDEIPCLGNFSCDCWTDSNQVWGAEHAACFSLPDSLGLHLSEGMEMSFKNTRGSKNLLKLISEYILLRLEVGLR